MLMTQHRLSIGRKNEDKKKDSYMPVIKNQRKPPGFSQKGHNRRPMTVPAKDDYFHLLFDENRKPFLYENYDGVDEYYTDDMIKGRILKMGFRDPEYYATRQEFENKEVPDEDKIRQDYTFKFPVQVSSMENENTLVAHVLGGTYNNIKHIEVKNSVYYLRHQSEIGIAKDKIKGFIGQKKELRADMDVMKKKFDKELTEMLEEFKKQFHTIEDQIKDDFIARQNEHFKLQKEITLLQRDKLNLEKQIELTSFRLEDVENQLYGRPIFELEPNQKELDNISEINLRPELSSSMKNRQIIH